MKTYEATEQAYKNGYERGYADGKRSAAESFMFPRFLIRQPDLSQKELEAILQSPVIIHKSREEIIPIYPYSRWIPVTERLPEEGESVLVFGYWHEKFQPLMCYLSPHRKGEWFTTVAGQQVYTVTHWMPLPEPPKGE